MKINRLVTYFLCVILVLPIMSAYVYAEDDVFEDSPVTPIMTNTPYPEIELFSSDISDEAVASSTELYNNFLSVDPDLFLYTDEGIGYFSWNGTPTADEWKYLENKAYEITKDCTSAYEKIFAVTEYMAKNICYDYDYLADTSNGVYLDPYDILVNGSTICEGYSRTTATLLQIADVACVYVDSPNHKWNVAYDGERWVMFDTTWVCSGTKTGGVLNKSDNLRLEWFDFTLEQANGNENHLVEEIAFNVSDGKLTRFPRYTTKSDIELPSCVNSIANSVYFPTKIGTLTVPESLESIGTYCFNSSAVNTIYYEGSKTEYNSISIGKYNSGITNCKNIIYADNAAKPYITAQPANTVGAVGEAVSVSLTAECENSNILYRWYTNDELSNVGGTIAEESATATYEFTPTAEGMVYLYAEVVSRDDSVSGEQEVITKSIPISVEVFKEIPTEIERIGANARYIRFEEADEAYLTGSGKIESYVFDDSSVIYISKGITYIPERYYSSTLRYKKNISVEEGNPYYVSDSDGGLYDNVTSELLVFPYNSEVVEYTIRAGTKSVDFNKLATSKLQILHIPESLETATGYYSWSLTEITVEAGNENFYVDEYGALIDDVEKRVIKFPSKSDAIDNYIMPEDIVEVAPYAFRQCKIKEVTMSPKLKKIGANAFWNCNYSARYFIPETVEEIGDATFAYNYGLRSVYFFGNIPNFGTDVFKRAETSSEITIYCAYGTDWTTPTWTDSDGTVYQTEPFDPEIVTSPNACGNEATWSFENNTLTISGKGAVWDYSWSNTVPWNSDKGSVIWVVVEEGITHIGDYCFLQCANLSSIELPNSLKSIGNYAFWNCNGIKGITLPENLTSIGTNAYEYCYGLSEPVYIPASVTTVGNYAFDRCTNLTSVYFRGEVPTSWGTDCIPNTVTLYYPAGNTSGWTTPTWTDSDGTVYNTAEYTPEVSDTFTVSGQITSYGDADEAVTVALYDADGNEVATTTTTSGTYSLTVSSGTYTMKVSKDSHVTREYDITVNGDDVTCDVEIWMFGDANADGKINGKDLTVIRRVISGGFDLTSYVEEAADVNNDGKVNGKDLTLIRRYISGGFDVILGQ